MLIQLGLNWIKSNLHGKARSPIFLAEMPKPIGPGRADATVTTVNETNHCWLKLIVIRKLKLIYIITINLHLVSLLSMLVKN